MALNMELRLSAPGMTSLHKAGLAGLYMTLKAFDGQGKKIKGLQWQLMPDRVILQWTDAMPNSAFSELVKEAFLTDKEGFFRFPGLESEQTPSIEQRHLLNNALLNSFLQFGPHRKTGNKKVLSYQVDDKLVWIKEFAPVSKYRHQEAAKDFIGGNGFKKLVELAGWLYPGGAQRHVAHSGSTLADPPEKALCLLFAPVGCIYFSISSMIKGRKTRGAVLVPAISNLDEYMQIRQIVASQGVLELTASGASDALLRFISLLKGNAVANNFSSLSGNSMECRLITFGVVDWNENQKSRTMTRNIIVGEIKGLNNYFYANAIFRNRWQMVKAKEDKKGNIVEPERYFVSARTAREIIAENIAAGKPWFVDFAKYFSDKEIRKQLLYERKELNEMVQKAEYENERERLFVGACHDAWRRQLGKLGDRARREKADFTSLANRASEKLRMSVSRCRNAKDLRETVVDFWARSGPIKALQENWHDILPLFDEKNWRLAKDLALLALASYHSESQEEEAALSAVQINEAEDKKHE